MNIRQRITLLIITTFLTLSFVGGFAIFQSMGSSREVKSVTEGVVPSAIASVELVTQLKDVQIATMNMVAAQDKDTVAKIKDEVTARKSILEKALNNQLTQADSNAQRGLVQQAQESLVNYFDAIDQTAQFKLAGQDVMAEALMSATVDQYLTEQGAIIETLQIEKRRSKDAAIDNMNNKLSYTSKTLSIATALAVLGLVLMGVLLYRQIIHPIADMEHKMTQIATSQDFTHRVPVKRMDEIGKSLTAFNTMVEKIQQSSDLVKQKTADIQAMLHNIPQGILTVTPGNTVHPEYSSYLASILETKDIAGRDATALVFSNTTLGADARAQMDAALSACIGEDAMNFEFNAHVLPHEIHKTMPDGKVKVLDISWSPITGENDIVERLMLCVWDVTELRALAAEAQAQKRELTMIGEILSIAPDKFQAFIHSAQEFILENRSLIPLGKALAPEERNSHIVSVLFRNMHTIKGNARTYGLLSLTNLVHEAEQAYDTLRTDADAPWDAEALLAQLGQVEETVNAYAHICASKLGRSASDAHGSKLLQQSRVQEALAVLDKVDETNPQSLREALQQVRSSLRLVDTESVEDVLAEVLQSLPSLAAELGKEAPVVTIQTHGIALKAPIVDTVKNVYMHLYRNAMDHGLETAAERQAKGKPAQGSIALDLALDSSHVQWTLKDDGKGLAVAHILKKAVAQGLVDAGAELAPQDIAQLIFTPGFSTAGQVTEISGRGVGMDAVKSFVERQGGTIALRLLPEAQPEPGFYPFETVIRLPKECVVQG
nr:ATP-binding protein [uncultured Albidiferax sp.]